MESAFERECRAAEAALGVGDLSHAAHHLAVALCHRTLDPRLRELLQRFATNPRAALDAIPEDDVEFAGRVALRALCLARLGSAAEALMLLCNLVCEGDRAYLRWARPWLLPLMETIDPQEAANAFLVLDGVALLPSDTKPLLALLERAHAAHPHHGPLFLARFRCVRDRVGAAEAEALAHARTTDHPDAFTELALASVRRHHGDLESSLRHYLAAADGLHDQAAPWLDVGDVLFDLGRESEALDAYEKVLDSAPADPWALPSALYLHATIHDDAEARAALVDYLADEPSNLRARTLAAWLAPFEFALPLRSEACLALAEQGQTIFASVAVTSFEAPSAVAVCRHLFSDSPVTIEFAHIPWPDPRMPARRVGVALWRFPRTGLGGLVGKRAFEGRPALRPPRALQAAQVSAIAARGFQRDAWWQDALDAARALGSNARAVALATMVNPPPNPSPTTRLADWVFAVQVAAALVIARSEAAWSGSRRRATLWDLVAGPVDWVATAALYALTEIGLREPEACDDCMRLLQEARTIRPTSPVVWTCLAEPALQLLLRFPNLDPAQRIELEAERERVGNLWNDTVE